LEQRKERREPATQTRETLAEAASGRAAMYDLLLDVFVSLPGEALVSEIKDGRFDRLVLACSELGGQRLCEGARLVASYRSHLSSEGPERGLRELSVDRTGLMGAAWRGDLRPPYERLYTTGAREEREVLAAVQGFYRQGGLTLTSDAAEPPDFLFVELDFVKRVCLREIEAWSGGGDGGATQALELRFLGEHPGKWTRTYCADAEKHARTDFFRGFLAVLDTFVEAEMAYLRETVIE